MAAETDDDRPPWRLLVWMGLLCGVALGAVVVLIFRDRRGGNGQQLSGPINIWNVAGGQPQLQGAPEIQMLPEFAQHMPVDPGLKTKLSTVTVSPTSSNRLMRASGNRRWAVEVRTVGPPGAFAMFGTGEISGSGATADANSIAVPAGDRHMLELDAGDYLFARGSAPGTVVSYSARQLA